MDKSRIGLKLTLDAAGLSGVPLRTFSDRLNVQKRVYLIQALGHDLGYRFGWYLRGPYCRELTADAFALRGEIESGDRDAEDWSLADETKASINRAEALWSVPQTPRVERDDWLELLASLHYLKTVAYWPRGSDRSFDESVKKLVDAKPRFEGRDSEARAAWNRLGEFGLIAV